MKPPLHVVRVPTKYSPLRYIPIADANHFIVCDVLVRDGAEEFADELVKKFNQPWEQQLLNRWNAKYDPPSLWKRLRERLFGPPRDARQRSYDAWIGERS
jgi:hypothetical protein